MQRFEAFAKAFNPKIYPDFFSALVTRSQALTLIVDALRRILTIVCPTDRPLDRVP